MFIIDECLIEFYATESTFDEGCRHDEESRASRCDVVDATLFNQNQYQLHNCTRARQTSARWWLCCVYANAPSRLAPEPGPGIHAFDGFQVFIHVPLGATRGTSGANERFALRCERG